MNSTSTYDLAIVGGGPAGMAAAVAARDQGLAVCLLDEQPRFGGQIYRQPPSEFQVDSWLPGAAYRRGKALIARSEGLSGLDHIAPATVWACFKIGGDGQRAIGHDVLFHDDEAIGRVRARHVVLACGCYEAPLPFSGWHLSGVMSAGAIQTLLKSQRVAAGRSIVLAGTHPLLFVVAEQLLSAGIQPAAVVVPQRASAAWRLARTPRTALTGARQLCAMLGTLVRLRRAGVPVIFGHDVVEVRGTDQLQSVRVRELGSAGKSRLIPCDALGVCYGFLPSSELARQAGAKHVWAREGGWVIECDEYMRSERPRPIRRGRAYRGGGWRSRRAFRRDRGARRGTRLRALELRGGRAPSLAPAKALATPASLRLGACGALRAVARIHRQYEHTIDALVPL